MSTRPFRLPDDDHYTIFSRQAMEGMLGQIRNGFVSMTPEHLTFLPPIGRWRDGSIVEASDGTSELILEGTELPHFVPTSSDPLPLAAIDRLLVASDEVRFDEIELSYEPRNYSHEEAAHFSETCPIPLHVEHAWSTLPPLEWVLALPVVWPAVRFVGAFFDELGHASGKAVVQWVQDASKRAHAPERDRLFTVRFDVEDGRYVYAFIPFAGNTNTDDLLRALETINAIASFAGLLRQGGAEPYDSWVRGTFIFDAGKWNFGWWTDGEKVYRTRWFDDKCPDPARFLGRPLFGVADLDSKEVSAGPTED